MKKGKTIYEYTQIQNRKTDDLLLLCPARCIWRMQLHFSCSMPVFVFVFSYFFSFFFFFLLCWLLFVSNSFCCVINDRYEQKRCNDNCAYPLCIIHQHKNKCQSNKKLRTTKCTVWQLAENDCFFGSWLCQSENYVVQNSTINRIIFNRSTFWR